nr:hypothetical protein [Tanacetum cinerariifolium]
EDNQAANEKDIQEGETNLRKGADEIKGRAEQSGGKKM